MPTTKHKRRRKTRLTERWSILRNTLLSVFLILMQVATIFGVLFMAADVFVHRSGINRLAELTILFIIGIGAANSTLSLLSESHPKLDHVYGKLLALIENEHRGNVSTHFSPTATAVAAFASSKLRQQRFAGVTLLLVAALFGAISVLFEHAFRPWVFVPVLAAVFILQAAEVAMKYRLRRGLFGTNEYEARQLITFVLAHTKDEDFSGGLGDIDVHLDEATERRLNDEWGLAPT